MEVEPIVSYIDQAKRAICPKIIAGLMLVFLSACAGPDNKQFSQLATSGVAFTSGLKSVYQYAWKQEVQSSNEVFEKNHKDAMALENPDTVLNAEATRLVADNRALIERGKIFSKMTQQAKLLSDYFNTIQVLAGGSKADEAKQAADASAVALGHFVKEFVEPIAAGKSSVNDIIGGVTGLVVGEFANAKLRTNLKTYGTIVLGSIKSQRVMLETLQNNVKRREVAHRLAAISAGYKKQGTLAENWGSKRLEALSYTSPANPVTAALSAAKQLEDNFRSLVEGKPNALDQLQRAIVLTNTLMDIYEGN